MFARTSAVAALVLACYVKNVAAVITCADLVDAGSATSDGEIDKSGANVFFSAGLGTSVGVSQESIVDTGSATGTGTLCITFTDLNLQGGSVAFKEDGTNIDYQFSGTGDVPNQFNFDVTTSSTIVYETSAVASGTGFRFQCSDTPCPCTTGNPSSSAFSQSGDTITSNGEDGTITAVAQRCLKFSNVDLQGGTLQYKGVTYTDGDEFGPFSVESGSENLVFNAGPTGQEGSFTVSCETGTCPDQDLSPCITTGTGGGVNGELDQQDQVIQTPLYGGAGYLAGSSVVGVTGPACLTFDDSQGYGTPNAVLTYEGSALSQSIAPSPISVASGETTYLQWLASGAGNPGFRLFCNFGTCGSTPTTTTQGPVTTTTQGPVTSTTSTATTTQTTVVPFPVSTCNKKSCRQLVKAKKQRLFTAAGCGDSTSCKNAVKGTMPYNGNKKKACKPKTRQDVCENIYWYT